MKTFLPLKGIAVNCLLSAAFLLTITTTKAQSGQSVPELVFKNPVIQSGNGGSNGAVYRFSNVGNNLDALVTVSDRSSPSVKITNIDLSNTGYDNAFQPQISYNNGNSPRNLNWWVEFTFNFVNKETTTPATVSKFNVSALDVDGDGSRLNEYVSFYGAQSYILERNSSITVKNLLDLILGLLTGGQQFAGPTKGYNGVDTKATDVMTTLTYTSKSSFKMRAGATTGSGSSSNTDRMYSLWFKSFDYNTPVQVTLPVKLISFSATLNNAYADLKWTTSSEKDVSHFSIEKSLDGQSFTQAGVVAATGNSSAIINYNFTDENINTAKQGIIYYRLRSIDLDGKSELSAVKMITINSQDRNAVSITTYPNPVSNELRITIPTAWQGKKITCELIGNSGQVSKRMIATSAGQTEVLSVNNLAPGFYLARVTCNGETTQQKIIKR